MEKSFKKLEKAFYENTVFSDQEMSALFDTIGLPAHGGWRAVYQVIFDARVNVFADNESQMTKARLEPVMKAAFKHAREKDFSQDTLFSLIKDYNIASYQVCHNQLTNVINELDELTAEFKASHLSKQKKVEKLESETVSTVRSKLSIEEKIKLIKAGFKETISTFHDDIAKLDLMTNTDHLTGLYNRRFFDEQLTLEVFQAHKEKTWLNLLMIDIDDFKHFNDTYGHLIGDQALKIIAKNIRTSCYEASEKIGLCFFPTRYGGEEFAIILPAIDGKQALNIAETIRSKVKDYIFVIRDNKGKIKHKNLSLTISIGMAALDHSQTQKRAIKVLIKSADAAMYEAKKAGKNCVRIFDQEG